MQNKFSNKTTVAKTLPLVLSAFLIVSATATAGSLTAKNTAPAHHKEIAKPKATPADSKPADQKKGDEQDAKAADKKKTPQEEAAAKAAIETSIASSQNVEPLVLLQSPTQYLNKKVTFTATFNRFADIALDYKKAFRDSRDYVTFFILRPDVTEHTIPLAEMKLFFPRKKSDEVMDLEAGDKIQIVGTEFATALDEPWIDVEHVKILQKVPRTDKKHSPEF